MVSYYLPGYPDRSFDLTKTFFALSIRRAVDLCNSHRTSLNPEIMSSFVPPDMDVTRFPFPLRSFVGGKYTDSSGENKHTLKSSVNDAIVTSGSWLSL
jgi:hypothetical protein